MTAGDILADYNTDRPNQVEDERKLRWLRTLDAQVMREVIYSHANEYTEDSGVDIGDPLNTDAEVLIPLTEEDDALQCDEDDAVRNLIKNFGVNTELIIPEPYGDVYIHFLDEKIALMNNDIDRYNTTSALYNNAYLTYQQWYNRTHRPKQLPSPLFDHRRL